MQTVAIWLAALLPSLVGRVLAALGMGVATLTGFTLAWTGLKGIIISNFQGIPADIAALVGLTGIGTGLGIVFGAITARVAFAALTSARKIVGV